MLLGSKEYSTAVDMWSVGCIFAELLSKKPLFPGASEIDQMSKIIHLLGTPNEKLWPGFSNLPHAKLLNISQPYSYLKSKFTVLTENGIDLLNRMLTYCPTKRITVEDALKHVFFEEQPLAKDPSLFPSWPSVSKAQK